MSGVELGAPDPYALRVMVNELRRVAYSAPALAEGLPGLFGKLGGLAFGLAGHEQNFLSFAKEEIKALEDFITGLRCPIEAMERSGIFANPWSAASLGRDEVRNASVLRWFLDPRGNHGCRDALLTYLLQRLASELGKPFPVKPSGGCAVAVEEYHDGESVSRVDIQIDDPFFFLVVEVKIDALEQPQQLKRYCEIASARGGPSRPWAVVFLTTNGRDPATAGDRAGDILSVAWIELAAALRRTVRSAPRIPRLLASSFASHMASH